MTHELKIEPQYFEAVLNGTKTFEIRYNDRGFQSGDDVWLREIELPGVYSGRNRTFKIGYVTNYGQKEGFVVFSLLPIKEKE